MKKYAFLILIFICYSTNAQTVKGLLKYHELFSFVDTSKIDLASAVDVYFSDTVAFWAAGRFVDLSEDKDAMIDDTSKKIYDKTYLNLKRRYVYEYGVWDFKPVLVKDTLSGIDWQIKDEYKMFGSIKCQLAEGMVYGRMYKAWFAPEIPVRFGPWKLYGLPGLILEARSVDKQVYFRFKSLKMNLDPSRPIPRLRPTAKRPEIKWRDYANHIVEQEENEAKMFRTSPGRSPNDRPPKIEHIEIYSKIK